MPEPDDLGDRLNELLRQEPPPRPATLAGRLRGLAGSALSGATALIAIPVLAIPSLGLLYAIWIDFRAGHFAWFAVDVLLSPFGAVRGLYLFFFLH